MPPLNSFSEHHEVIKKQAYLNKLRTRGHKVEDLIDHMARLLAIRHSPANQDGEWGGWPIDHQLAEQPSEGVDVEEAVRGQDRLES